MYHRASELKHIFNENMKGGTGTVEIIRSVNPIDYESPAKMIAKLILRRNHHHSLRSCSL